MLHGSILGHQGLYFQADPGGGAGGTTDPEPGDDADERFDKHPRFQKLNKERNDAIAELERIRAEAQNRETEELTAQKKWEDLYNKETKETAKLKKENLRLKIGRDLPDEIAERLQGETEEEMRADAEKMRALFKTDKSETAEDKTKSKTKSIPSKSKDGSPTKISGSPAEIRANKKAILENANTYVNQ